MGTSATTSTLTIGGNNGAGSGRLTLVIGANGNFDVLNSGATLNLTADISGAFTITKTGSGKLILAGSNSFSNFTQSNGTTQLSGIGTLGLSTGTLTVNGGTLDLNGTSQNTGNFTGSGGTILNNSTGTNATLTIGNGNGTGGSFAGAIVDHTSGTGTVALVKAGTGTITLTGSNTFTGVTTLTAGTLAVNGALGALANTTALTVQGGGTFQLGDATNGLANRLNTAATLTLGGTSGGIFTLFRGNATTANSQTLTSLTVAAGSSTINNSGTTGVNPTLTFTGATPYIRNAGGFANLTSAASGTDTISFTNAPTGSSVAGSLLIGAALNGTDFVAAASGALAAPTYTTFSASGAISGDANVTGSGTANSSSTFNSLRFNTGAFVLTLAGSNTVSSGGILVGSGATSGTISGGTIQTASSGDLWVYLSGKPLTINSVVGDNGTSSLSVGGTSTLTLAGSNLYTGSTVVSGGTLQIGNGSTGNLAAGSGTITTNAGSTLAINLAANDTLANTIVNNGTLSKTAGAVTNILSGNISGSGVLTQNIASGTLALSGTNNYSGVTTITAGALEYRAASAISANSAVTVNGGTLGLRADADTIFAFPSISFSTGATSAIAINSLNSPAGDNHTMTLTGQVAANLNADTTFNISSTTGDTLKFTASFHINGASGGAFGGNNNTFNLTNANVIFNAGIDNSAGNTDSFITVASTTGNSLTVNGTVSSNGSRTIGAVVNSGVLTLNNTVNNNGGGANNGFWVTLNGGTLNVNNAGAISNNNFSAHGNNGFLIAGGTLNNTSGSALTLATNASMGIGINGDFAFSTAGGASANDLSLGTNAVTLGAPAGTSRTITTNGSATLTIGGVISNGTTANSIIKSGTGTLALSNANLYTGGTTVKSGTLVIGNATALGNNTLTIGDGNGTAAATVTSNLGGSTIANNIVIASGSSGVASIKNIAGGGTTTTYSGTLTLNKDLTINAFGSAGSSGFQKFTGVISGTGNITVDGGSIGLGANAWFSNSGNSINGNITIQNAGTLLTSTGALGSGNVVTIDSTSQLNTTGQSLTIAGLNGSGSVTVSNSSSQILTLAGGGTYSFGGNIGNAGGVTKSGSGTQTLTATNGYTGATLVSNGRLAVNGSIAASSGVTVNGTGTLGGTGTVSSVLVSSSTATVAPGNSNGLLTVNGNFDLGGGKFNVQLDKTTAGQITTPGQQNISGVQQYDRLAVTGTVSVASATLALQPGQNLVAGDKYYILDNQGTGSTGVFSSATINGASLNGGSSLAEGGLFSATIGASTYSFLINYTGNVTGSDNNDIFLTAQSVPEPTSLCLLGLGSMALLSRRRRKA